MARTVWGGYPNACQGCPEPLRFSDRNGPSLWFECGEDGVQRSWHAECRLAYAAEKERERA